MSNSEDEKKEMQERISELEKKVDEQKEALKLKRVAFRTGCEPKKKMRDIKVTIKAQVCSTRHGGVKELKVQGSKPFVFYECKHNTCYTRHETLEEAIECSEKDAPIIYGQY